MTIHIYDLSGEKSIKFYKRLADLQDYDAKYFLGKCYLQGDCVEKNSIEAINYFSDVADNCTEDAAENSIIYLYMIFL